jgi:hypothetical protein
MGGDGAGVLCTSALVIPRFGIIWVRTMPYPSFPLTKRRLTIEPQARRCMEHLGITADEVLTTMNAWESSSVVATAPMTANTVATSPETAEEIPAFYEAERTFPEHHLTLTVDFSTSMKPRPGKPTIVSATVHWVSSHAILEDREPLPERELNYPLTG